MIISPLIKIFARPLVRGLDAMLEKLDGQIREGRKDEAAQTVAEIRAAVTELRKYLE